MDLLLTDPFIGDKSTDIKRQRSLKYGDFLENYNKKISKVFGFMVVAGYDVSFVDKINKVLTEEYKKIRPKNDILGNDGLCFIHSVKSDTGEEKDIVIVEESSLDLRKQQAESINKIPVLESKIFTIRDNQTGISYRKLFGDYLVGSESIILTDPFIRLPYQFNNLVEFCVMLSKIKQTEDEVKLHVITWNTEERTPDSIDNFDEIAEDVAELGINLTYEFQDLHDRNIVSDNGWKIVLGRGLDIFNPREGRFNAASILQEKRTCKNCEISYFKSKM